MTTPRGAPELTDGQAVPEATVNEIARYLEQGAGSYIFKDRDLTAPPGSPAEGDCYLVAASPTGDWTGHAGDITFYLNGAWEFVEVIDGLLAYVVDENILIVRDATWQTIASLAGSTTLYRPVSFFFTTTPTATEVMLIYVASEAITFADEFAGSTASVGTNPTSSFVLTVKKNGSSVGTITISTGGAATFVTTGTTVVLASGDVLSVTAPGTPDATIANVAITLKGTL